MRRDHIPIEPLQAFLRREIVSRGGLRNVQDLTGLDDEALTKIFYAERRSVDVYRADQIIVALGCHPCEIYGHVWIEAGIRDSLLARRARRKPARRAAA